MCGCNFSFLLPLCWAPFTLLRWGGSLARIQNPADRTRNLIRDRSSILGQVAEFRHQVAPTYRKCAPYSLTSVTLGGLFETIAKPALCGDPPRPPRLTPDAEQVWGADCRSPAFRRGWTWRELRQLRAPH